MVEILGPGIDFSRSESAREPEAAESGGQAQAFAWSHPPQPKPTHVLRPRGLESLCRQHRVGCGTFTHSHFLLSTGSQPFTPAPGEVQDWSNLHTMSPQLSCFGHPQGHFWNVRSFEQKASLSCEATSAQLVDYVPVTFFPKHRLSSFIQEV